MAFAPSRRLTPRRVRFKKAPLATALLTVDALPSGDWQIRSERAMRSGASASSTAAGERADAAGLVTVGRTFKDRETRRGVWVQLNPWATEADAQARFDAGETELHANLTSGAVKFTVEEVDAPAVAGADIVRAVTYRLPARKHDTTMLMLVWRVGAVVGTVGADARDPGDSDAPGNVAPDDAGQGSWSWVEVARLAEDQIRRLSDLSPTL